jgi:3-oxoadipate enol-lactonase
MPRVTFDDGFIHYRWDGPEGDRVVMMSHSLASDLGMWDAQLPPLVEAGYRVLRYDHRGHGRSAVTPGPYTIDMLAGDALGLMDELKLDKVHFVGLSMGGMVGQVLGASHGDRLFSLTLSSTASHMPPPELWHERIQAVRAHGPGATADATIDRWFTQAGQARLPEAVRRIREAIRSTTTDGFCACCAAIRDMDLREAIRSITVPTLITVGEHDQGTPVAAAQFIHGRIAGSQLKIVPDAAHMLNIEQAAVFNQTMLGFLKTVPMAAR